jgi:hypothetical protein
MERMMRTDKTKSDHNRGNGAALLSDTPVETSSPTPEAVLGNGTKDLAGDQVLQFPRADEAALDEIEALERACILDDDDGDEPGETEEKSIIPIVNKPPKFARFRSNPSTMFDLWGTTDEKGLDKIVVAASKDFAAVLEEEIELRRVRFFETVTEDGIVRLIYAFLPDKDGSSNTWLTSKLAALEASCTQWVTMRSVKKLQQYTWRPAKKDYGEPKFSGKRRGELLGELRQQGLLAENTDHPFYRKAADLDDE